MGLRAFTSQLLCEQVIGRGLRRVSCEVQDGLFVPEYVNVFGVPLSIALQPGEGGAAAWDRIRSIDPESRRMNFDCSGWHSARRKEPLTR